MSITEQDLQERALVAKFAANIAQMICKLDISLIKQEVIKNLLTTLKQKISIPYDLDEVANGKFKLQNTPDKISSKVSDVVHDIATGKPIVILDLDETLINVYQSLRTGEFEISPRPGAHLLIETLESLNIEIILWTAGVRQHAQAALGIVDPNQRIQRVIYRPDTIVHKDGRSTGIYTWADDPTDSNFYRKKALSLLPPELQKNAILIDDNVTSLSHESTVKSSICVPSYTSGYQNGKYYRGEPIFDLHLIRILNILLRSILTFRSDPKATSFQHCIQKSMLKTEQREFTEFDSGGSIYMSSASIQVLNTKVPSLSEQHVDELIKQFSNALNLICRHRAVTMIHHYYETITPTRPVIKIKDDSNAEMKEQLDSDPAHEKIAPKTALSLI